MKILNRGNDRDRKAGGNQKKSFAVRAAENPKRKTNGGKEEKENK
nr:hypothetical protein [Methanimicrococcus sp. At1]